MRKICAGIITFNPDLELLKSNIAILKEQLDYIYIIDNGSTNIDQIKLIDKKIEVISLLKNMGIATALNRLMIEAERNEFEWVLSMDQDTLIHSNVINIYSKHIDNSKLGILTLKVIRKSSTGEILFETSSKNKYEYVDRCPTSGMMIRTSVWRMTGGYNDWMFIDYVDYDICQKVLLVEKKILRVNETHMTQQLGDGTKLSILGKVIYLLSSNKMKKKIVVFNHNPTRNYYYVRNSIYFIRKYKKNINVSLELKKIVKWEVKKLFFEKRFFAQFGALTRGVIDGIRINITK